MAANDQAERLFEKARAGDRESFEDLVGRSIGRLKSLVRRRIGSPLRRQVDVEDVLQETLLRAFQSLGKFRWESEDKFFGWLGGIAENLILHEAREGRRHPVRNLDMDLVDSVLSQSTAMRRDERFERLEQAVNALDPLYRQVIFLARIEGLGMQEIARRIKRSPEATRKLLARAIRKLRVIFGETESYHLPDRGLKLNGNGDG